jgi:MFS family permease
VQQPGLTTASAAWTIYPLRFLLAFAQGGLLSPLLPLLRETFHVSYGELGLLTAMPGLSSVVMDIIATYLLSHRPPLRTLLQGIALTGIALLGSMLAPGFYWLVGAQMLLGFGITVARLMSLTVVVAATPREAMGRANNLLEFSAIAGIMLSPTLSGLMAYLLHWRAAFGVAVVFVGGAFAWVLYHRQILSEAMGGSAVKYHPGATQSAASAGTPTALPAPPHAAVAVRIAYLTTFVLSFTWSGFISTALPLFGGEVIGVPVSTLGMVFTIGLLCDLVLLMPIGWLSDRLEYRTVLAPAMLLMAFTLACMSSAHSLGTLILVSIGLHTGFAAWGMPSAALALYVPGDRLTRTMGIYRLLVDGAVVIAPWLIGTLIEQYGYGVPAYGTAAVLVLNAVLVMWGLRAVQR